MTHSPQNNASSINIAIVLQIGVGSFDRGFPVRPLAFPEWKPENVENVGG